MRFTSCRKKIHGEINIIESIFHILEAKIKYIVFDWYVLCTGQLFLKNLLVAGTNSSHFLLSQHCTFMTMLHNFNSISILLHLLIIFYHAISRNSSAYPSDVFEMIQLSSEGFHLARINVLITNNGVRQLNVGSALN